MNKPWNNESTPITDYLVDANGDIYDGRDWVARLEQRMRNAERILKLYAPYLAYAEHRTAIQQHMDAALVEDNDLQEAIRENEELIRREDEDNS